LCHRRVGRPDLMASESMFFVTTWVMLALPVSFGEKSCTNVVACTQTNTWGGHPKPLAGTIGHELYPNRWPVLSQPILGQITSFKMHSLSLIIKLKECIHRFLCIHVPFLIKLANFWQNTIQIHHEQGKEVWNKSWKVSLYKILHNTFPYPMHFGYISPSLKFKGM